MARTCDPPTQQGRMTHSLSEIRKAISKRATTGPCGEEPEGKSQDYQGEGSLACSF